MRRLRIAFLSQNSVVPLDNGGRIRNYHLLRAMARRHEVHVVLTEPPPARERAALLRLDLHVHEVPKGPLRYATYLAEMAHGAPAAIAVQVNPGLARWVRGAAVDVVVAGTAARAARLRRAGWDGPLIIDTHNLEHVRLRREVRSRGPLRGRLLGHLWTAGIERFEREAFRGCTVVVCSRAEARQLAGWDTQALAVVENGVDLGRFPSLASGADAPTVVLTGDLAYAPNVQAAVTFARELAPRLLRSEPGLRLVAAGRGADAGLRRLLSEAGVDVRSPVERMEDVLAEAHATVVPLASGGGTRLKVVEAFAAGVPVVASPIGAEGIDARHGEEILIAEGADAMADAVLRLVRAPDTRRSIARAARRLAEERYSWETLGDRFTDVVETAAARAAATSEETA